MRRRSNKIDPWKKIAARVLLFLSSILWLVYMVFIYFDMAVVNQNDLAATIVAIFVFVNAVAMFASGLALGNQQKPAFYFTLVVVILNIILTILNLTDLIFVIAFIFDILILWLLMNIRNGYLVKP
jgi:hypothetical protein